MMTEMRFPLPALIGLGLTQIIGYGTLFYSFSVLVPAIATDFGWTEQWVFATLSGALLVGGLFAPMAGRWADRFGAGRVLCFGSIAAAGALLATAMANERLTFAIALVAMQVASTFVLYSTAFVAIVQFGGCNPRRTITHLTLIAGFASTLFWPLTASLHQSISWRDIYMLFAAMNLFLCLPIHLWLAHLLKGPRHVVAVPVDTQPSERPVTPPAHGTALFTLMLLGFALEGLVLSAVLIHMVPLTVELDLGSSGLLVASLFGPAQVASRLVNMLFGKQITQTSLAVIAACLLVLGLIVLTATAPWLPGAITFAILFGMGSGLISIVSGTLPLELFGKHNYGARLGWVTAAKQLSSAAAPFSLASALAWLGVLPSLWITVATGAAGILTFAAIAVFNRRDQHRASGAGKGLIEV
ncbi:hypothetical protein LPJGGPFB_05785 [Ensifer adhaerens]|nr:hypothetical protein [Ensifer adhaerens]